MQRLVGIHKVLKLANDLEILGSAAALLDFEDIHDEIIAINKLSDDLQDKLTEKGIIDNG